MSQVKLKKFLLRYYPPGIILQYERDGVMKQKPVDLLDLGPGVDVEVQLHVQWQLHVSGSCI
jgi:dynein assembly factor with WDR repeat domains 1